MISAHRVVSRRLLDAKRLVLAVNRWRNPVLPSFGVIGVGPSSTPAGRSYSAKARTKNQMEIDDVIQILKDSHFSKSKEANKSSERSPVKLNLDLFVLNLLEELPTLNLEKVIRNKPPVIIDVDAPLEATIEPTEPEVDVIPDLQFDLDHVEFLKQFKDALHEDLIAGVRNKLTSQAPGTEVDLSIQFGGLMKDCKILRQPDLVTLQAVVPMSDFGDSANYFLNELVHLSVPSDPSKSSEAPMFGHARLVPPPDGGVSTDGILHVRILPSTLLQLTGNDLSRRLPFSSIRWTHMQSLTSYYRKTLACDSKIKPVFFKQISQRQTVPWPSLPPWPKLFRHLNEEQNFMVNTLASTTESGIFYLIGPPGTGKTTALVELLKERVKNFPDERILVVTPSNRAVQVVVQQFLASAVEETLPVLSLSTILDNIPPELFHTHPSHHARHILEPLRALRADPEEDVDSLLNKFAAARSLVEARAVRVMRSPVGKYDDRLNDELERALSESASRTYRTGSAFRTVEGVKLNIETLLNTLTVLIPAAESYYLERSQIIFTTLIGSGGKYVKIGENRRDGRFDCVILDEASQTDYAEAMIPMKFSPRLFIQIGDPMQLGAMADSEEFKRKGYAESMIARMTAEKKDLLNVMMLKEQYRMHPSIRKWVSDHSYDGLLREAQSVQNRPSPLSKLPHTMLLSNFPSAFVNVKGSEAIDHTHSICNLPEAHAIVETVQFLIESGVAPETIGVITFYYAQVMKIKGLLQESLTPAQAAQVYVSTVDGCQGDEKDFVLLSCVRTVPTVGFLRDERRVNVAMSRAKHARWVFGHEKTLAVSDSVFSEFFEWIKNRKKNNTLPPTRVLEWRNVKLSFTSLKNVIEKLDSRESSVEMQSVVETLRSHVANKTEVVSEISDMVQEAAAVPIEMLREVEVETSAPKRRTRSPKLAEITLPQEDSIPPSSSHPPSPPEAKKLRAPRKRKSTTPTPEIVEVVEVVEPVDAPFPALQAEEAPEILESPVKPARKPRKKRVTAPVADSAMSSAENSELDGSFVETSLESMIENVLVTIKKQRRRKKQVSVNDVVETPVTVPVESVQVVSADEGGVEMVDVAPVKPTRAPRKKKVMTPVTVPVESVQVVSADEGAAERVDVAPVKPTRAPRKKKVMTVDDGQVTLLSQNAPVTPLENISETAPPAENSTTADATSVMLSAAAEPESANTHARTKPKTKLGRAEKSITSSLGIAKEVEW